MTETRSSHGVIAPATGEVGVVLNLCETDRQDVGIVGGKALSLGKMINAHLPVPEGFCLTAEAFKTSGGKGLLSSHRAEIIHAYTSLGNPCVAVRSSSTAEDGTATSFAGQQETLLGVQGIDALFCAIESCWRSLHSHRAAYYRRQHLIDGTSESIAVIVQTMIPADAAGVVFTSDPFDANADAILIEASWGLGEATVSGRVTPDRWRLEKSSGRVCREEIATKTLEATSNGIQEVEPERQRRPSLDHHQLDVLARLACQVEELFAMPCDIEWALSDEQFWLLQARPITRCISVDRDRVREEEIAGLRSKVAPERTVWSRIVLAETLPEPTPLTWSLVQQLMSGQGGYGRLYRDLGFDPASSLDRDGIFDLVFGRPYCNLSREPLLYSQDLPLENSFEVLKANPALALNPQPVLNPARLDTRFWLRLPIVLGKLIVRTISTSGVRGQSARSFEQQFLNNIIPSFSNDARQALAENLTGVSTNDVWQKCNDWNRRLLVDFARESLKPAAIAQIAMRNLERRLAQYMDSERARQTLRRLIMNVLPQPGVDLVGAMRLLSIGQLNYQDFIAQFGHRGRHEMELSEPRWGELDLESIPAIANEQHCDSCHDMKLFDSIWATINEEFKGLLHQRVRALALELRLWISLRETAKHYFMLGYAVLRKLVCELDERFRLNGGIFYLSVDEIPQLIEGMEFKELIQMRRRRRQILLQFDLPDVIFSDQLDVLGENNDASISSSFAGTPVSSGIAEGPALVLRNPTHEVPLEQYVLVCPSTDPAWVSLFHGAKALVMETGGVLSHGAIVAREFGIPAVAGLPGILTSIKNGQKIRVDGETGLISILNAE